MILFGISFMYINQTRQNSSHKLFVIC